MHEIPEILINFVNTHYSPIIRHYFITLTNKKCFRANLNIGESAISDAIEGLLFDHLSRTASPGKCQSDIHHSLTNLSTRG